MPDFTPNRELLINDAHNNKYIFVLERIPTSYLISKFANKAAEYCIENGHAPDDILVQRLQEGNEDVRNFNLYLQTFDLPQLDLGYSTNATQFVDIPHVDGKLNYGELNMTVKNDENWLIYDMLYYWFLAGFNPEERMKFKEREYYEHFYVSGTLIVLNNHLEKCKEFEFTDLHPVSLSTVNLSDNESEKIFLPVTWIHTGFVPSDRYVIKRV